MSSPLFKDTKFKSEAKFFFKENKEEILDIILFGSSVRNKEKPNDIDILILFKDKKNVDISYEFKKRLQKAGYNADVTDKTYIDLLDGSFKASEGILSEGYSLINNKFLSEGFGYANLTLFKYQLNGLTKSQRMMFYYSLYGRGQKGMLEELGAIKFSDSILFCNVKNTEQMREYLRGWKIDFLDFPVLIPLRMNAILATA